MKPNRYFKLLGTLKELMLLHEQVDDIQLMAMMEKGEPIIAYEFEAAYSEECKMSVLLDIRASRKDDSYFLNKYEATLQYSGSSDKNRRYTFHILDRTAITSVEAFNLLDGRAVYKQFIDDYGKKYNGWMQFDFANRDLDGQYKLMKTGLYYTFDLETALSHYNIQELENAREKDNLLRCLLRGDLYPVNIITGKTIRLMHIRANPFHKIISLRAPFSNSRKN